MGGRAGRGNFRADAGRAVNIKIPAGHANGQKLRVRGRGLPARNGPRGDLFVVTQIAVPAKIIRCGEKIVGTARAGIAFPSAGLTGAAACLYDCFHG